MQPWKTFFYTLIALIAFAGNSVLCRIALKPQNENLPLIDGASFTLIRLLSGALILLLLISLKDKGNTFTLVKRQGSWLGAASLFIYAIGFSFAYIVLDTATGALVLFGAVQLTVILISIFKGGRLSLLEWLGLITAFGGFVYLVLPNISSPSWSGFLIMSIAGVAWGIYTYQGLGSKNPLADTGANFVKSLTALPILGLFMLSTFTWSAYGVFLAIASGVLTSGIGYAIWYTALRHLTPTIAAVCQLSVPIIAALGGIVFVNETISIRLLISATFILGGIAMVIGYRYLIQTRFS